MIITKHYYKKLSDSAAVTETVYHSSFMLQMFISTLSLKKMTLEQ